jgi:hemerythrin-like domain-containing protein
MVELSRRKLLGNMSFAAPALLLGVQPLPCEAEEEDVSPSEDLMREHGVLTRVLLVYEHTAHKIQTGEKANLTACADAKEILREFIENHHERDEEKYLFPRFEKANKLTDLVAVLKHQHDVGRQLTDVITENIQRGANEQLATNLLSFVHMYRPHQAREDTVLFPAFRSLVSKRQYNELKETFEEEELKHFGKDGFDHFVEKISSIEKELGIYDLATFTIKVPIAMAP